jgi:hypothetical protein
MKTRILFLSLFLFILSGTLLSQNLGAYSDYMDQFYIFDKGTSKKFEDLRVQSYMIGGENVLYINNAGHLKMYYQGNITLLERGGITSKNYFAKDHLSGYNIFEKLKVVYKGEIIELSSRCSIYEAQDSLVAFYDLNEESLRVFYKGAIQDIESGMLGSPISKWKSGDNIVAYISSRTNDFKIWYRGDVQVIIKNVEETLFRVGKDIVAYVDPLDESFKAFYKGEIYELNDFAPESFRMGDMFVAFVDHMGEFKIFENGEVKIISTITPEGYMAEDYSLAYIEDGRFWVWHNNQAIEIEAWVPTTYKLDWNTIAYLDNSQRIWVVQNGERKYLSNELVNTFEIYRDLIQMNVKVNRNIIYYQEKFYEGESFFK